MCDKCKGCIHRRALSGKTLAVCQYAIDTGRLRGCAPEDCPHWQPYEDTVQCSACGFGTFMDGYFFVHGECTHADDRSFRFSFCPNCGAKMDEKVEE